MAINEKQKPTAVTTTSAIMVPTESHVFVDKVGPGSERLVIDLFNMKGFDQELVAAGVEQVSVTAAPTCIDIFRHPSLPDALLSGTQGDGFGLYQDGRSISLETPIIVQPRIAIERFTNAWKRNVVGKGGIKPNGFTGDDEVAAVQLAFIRFIQFFTGAGNLISRAGGNDAIATYIFHHSVFPGYDELKQDIRLWRAGREDQLDTPKPEQLDITKRGDHREITQASLKSGLHRAFVSLADYMSTGQKELRALESCLGVQLHQMCRTGKVDPASTAKGGLFDKYFMKNASFWAMLTATGDSAATIPAPSSALLASYSELKTQLEIIEPYFKDASESKRLKEMDFRTACSSLFMSQQLMDETRKTPLHTFILPSIPAMLGKAATPFVCNEAGSTSIASFTLREDDTARLQKYSSGCADIFSVASALKDSIDKLKQMDAVDTFNHPGVSDWELLHIAMASSHRVVVKGPKDNEWTGSADVESPKLFFVPTFNPAISMEDFRDVVTHLYVPDNKNFPPTPAFEGHLATLLVSDLAWLTGGAQFIPSEPVHRDDLNGYTMLPGVAARRYSLYSTQNGKTEPVRIDFKYQKYDATMTPSESSGSVTEAGLLRLEEKDTKAVVLTGIVGPFTTTLCMSLLLHSAACIRSKQQEEEVEMWTDRVLVAKVVASEEVWEFTGRVATLSGAVALVHTKEEDLMTYGALEFTSSAIMTKMVLGLRSVKDMTTFYDELGAFNVISLARLREAARIRRLG
jgi:hypothetical protein